MRQFIGCMKEELESILISISERDDRCKLDMTRIESKILQND